MKRFAFILSLFCTLNFAAPAADFVFSNNAVVIFNGDSFWGGDTLPAPIVNYRTPEYINTYFALNYPGSNIDGFNLSHSGGNMDIRLTNDIPQNNLAIWGYQSNNFQHVGLSLSTDNGGLSGNQMYLSQSNVCLAPVIMSDGGFPLTTQTGWAATHPVQWIVCGYPPADSIDGDPVNEKGRNDAGVNAGNTFGVLGIDLWTYSSHGWTNDFQNTGGQNVQWFSSPKAGHFGSGGALDQAFAILSKLTTDTNISLCTVDWGGTIVSTNHCFVSSVSKSGSTLSFNRHDDRLPFAWDMPTQDGTHTNDSSGAFVLNPANLTAFHFDVTITGLPVGNHTLKIDGVTIGIFTHTQFGAGINMFANMTNGPYADQRRAVLDLERAKDYVDPKTLVPGSAGDHLGLQQYGSNAHDQFITQGKRGDALIAALNPFAKIVFDAAAAENAAAIPTTHTFTVQPASPTAVASASALTNAINTPVILDATGSTNAVTYFWKQTNGSPTLDLIGQDRVRPIIVSATNAGAYAFQLIVGNNGLYDTNAITITFINPVGRTNYVDNLLTANTAAYSIANRDGSGTDGNGYTNIQYAADHALPGDMIFIRAGLYTNAPISANQVLVNVTNSGSVTNPIIFQNYNGESVALGGWGFSDADTNSDGNADGVHVVGLSQTLFKVATNVNYIQVRGLEMTNSQGTALSINGNFCYVSECQAHDNWTIGFNFNRAKAPTQTLQGDVLRWCQSYQNRHFSGFYISMEDTSTFGYASDLTIADCISYKNGYTPAHVQVLPGAGDSPGGGNSDGITVSKLYQDNSTFNPSSAPRNLGTNFYFVRNIAWSNCDDGIDLSCSRSLVEDNRSLFNGPTGTMGYKLFRNVQDMWYRGNVAYMNQGRGFELRENTNSTFRIYNNTAVWNAEYGFTPLTIDSTSIFLGTNNVAAYNGLATGNADWNSSQPFNWSSDGRNTAFHGNPQLTSTNLVLNETFTAGWTVKQKHDFIDGQIKTAMTPAAGSPLIHAGLFNSGYFTPTADNDPTQPALTTDIGRHWVSPAPDFGAFDTLSINATRTVLSLFLR